MSATCVSLINMKGGVGKTTLAFNLAWYAAYKRRMRVLVVDLDPQANASQYLMGAEAYKTYLDENRPTVFHIFEQYTPSGFDGSMGPSSLDVSTVIYPVKKWSNSSFIHLIPSRLELSWTLKNPTNKDHLLARFLTNVQNDYDLILIDCAPTESILTTAVYRASRFVVIPIKPEFLASIGLPLLVRSLESFKHSLGDQDIEIAGIVFNDTDPTLTYEEHNISRSEVRNYASKQGWHVFENEVRHSNSYPKGARNKKPIFLTDYARSNVINEFTAFGREFLERVGF
ncbi:ParA family protein [Paenibacillus polymyxa]|uniref:Chromosome partitioning protein n=1 Tax=Paenibacillus polymyxa (strain SC2) TaxID=886882 RepID=E3EC89_PAEPS|nr:ParA family protein [Paenibacillus polymyxa]ADO54232.1 chromosome partitioning protein [Paenibacillus polymyxa SC2]WPQ57153.1 ParA family protein [Paenibacillus polymyxa]CCC83162.1 soj-like protein [Paenibacillus polymyxa M1]